MAEQRNIVVVGAAFAGLSAAHYYLKHIHPVLKDQDKNVTYKLYIVDPSSHFWHRVAAPRAMVNKEAMPHEKTFVPIANGFKMYDSSAYEIVQAEVTAIDIAAHNVTVRSTVDGNDEAPCALPYYALILAPGTRSATPLTTLQGDHQLSIKALDEMNIALKNPNLKSIVISGGGPVAVEAAGEIAEAINGLKVSPSSPAKVDITLVTAGKQVLPVMSPKRAEKAVKHLTKSGVKIIYGTRVNGTQQQGDKTDVKLSDGKTITTDIFLDGAGVTPNTEFVPANLLNEKRYIKSTSSLRVEGAGERVYVVGDAGDYTRGGIMEIYGAVPVLGANMLKDLTGKTVPDKVFKGDTSETQFVPLGTTFGVGAVKGFGFPGFAVKMIKGKDYFVKNIPQFTEGLKWVKA